MSRKKHIEMHEVSSSDRRSNYRRKPSQAHPLSITMRTSRGEEHVGTLQDLSIGGAAARFPIHANVIGPGQIVTLVIGSLSRPGKIIAKAKVLYLREAPSGRHCGFAFVEPLDLARQVDAFYARCFNRRKSERFGAPLGKRIRVKLFHDGVETPTELIDLSLEGMQVRTTRAQAKALDGANHVQLSFELPPTGATVQGRAAILRRTQLRDQVTLGLAFDLLQEDGVSASHDLISDWSARRAWENSRWDSGLAKPDAPPAAERPPADDGRARDRRPG